jgi:hypothetical protein
MSRALAAELLISENQQAARADGAGSDRGTLQQERTAVRQTPGLFDLLHYLLL